MRTTTGVNDSGSAGRANRVSMAGVSSSRAQLERLHVHLSPQERVARGVDVLARKVQEVQRCLLASDVACRLWYYCTWQDRGGVT